MRAVASRWQIAAAMPDSWWRLWDSFVRFFRVDGDASTLDNSYSHAIAQFGAFAYERGRRTPLEVERAGVEAFIEGLRATKKPATVNARFGTLRRLYNWLVEEGGLQESPMRRLRPPAVPDSLPQVIGEDELRRILAARKGNDFHARRDAALIRVLDTGGRGHGSRQCRSTTST